jgi:hypothetical protein
MGFAGRGRMPTARNRAPPRLRAAAALAVGVAAVLLAGMLTGVGARASPVPALSLATAAVNNGVSPPPTQRGMTAYDAADGYVLLFGGLDENLSTVGTTWKFDHGNWSNLTPTLAAVPSPRWGAGVAYDVADGYVVMFGGCPDNACSSVLADTWTFSHGKWTDLTGSLNLSPPAREAPSMTYDAALGRVLLFGGGGPPGLVNDTWTFAGGTWSRMNTSAAPPARDNAMLAFDPALNESVLFGGTAASGNVGDTWTFQNRTWAAVPSGPGPAPRHAGVLVWDATDRYLLQAAGYAAGTYYGDTWTFGSGGWTPLTTTGAIPGPSYGSNAAYDAADGYVLYFSGEVAQGTLTATWTYADGHWTILINPPGNHGNSAAALFILVFVPVLFVVVLPISLIVQRRRLRRLGEGFPLGPGTPVRWVPTPPGALGLRWSRFAAFLVVPFIILPLAIIGNNWVFVFIEAAIFLPLVVALIYGQRSLRVSNVGIAREGVVFQLRVATIRIPWGNLRPPMYAPRGRPSLYFQYSDPERANRMAAVEVTTEQARAILTAPDSPGYPLAPAVANSLGLPTVPRTPPPPPPPPPPGAAPSTYRATSRGAVVATSAPLPSSASPYVTCPGCGGVSRRGQWRFCQNCGRPLPTS